jgi:hypothetical protein
MSIVGEMKKILSQGLDELEDKDTLNGIVGAVVAYTHVNLEEVSHMQLTFQEYTVISPAIRDIENLIGNQALGSYTQTLCILMYRLGQQNARENTTSEREPEPPSGSA